MPEPTAGVSLEENALHSSGVTNEPLNLPSTAWRSLFAANLDALFQTALLLTADPQEAEENMIKALGHIDFSRRPSKTEIAHLQCAVVIESLSLRRPVTPATLASAHQLLQPGLWPVLHLQYGPRVCFVLRFLLGYATSSCAQMLGTQESEIRRLLQIATVQLHQLVANTSLETNTTRRISP